MKLLGYILNGNVLGTQVTAWTNDQLNGNRPFITIADNDATPNDYSDISSIITWGSLGQNVKSWYDVRLEIQKLLPNSLTGLTESELAIVSEYKLDVYYEIYDYIIFDDSVDPQRAPLNLDYDIIGLHKKRTLSKGELVVVEYYGKYDSGVYSNLIIREERVYYRVNQMVSRREMDIKWYLNDGTVGTTKHTIKYYSTTESMQELDSRRSNIISDLKINTVGLVMLCSGVTSVAAQTIARPMVSTYNLEISKYLQGYEQELRTAVANDTIYPWLDLTIPNTGGLTIRQYLISGLTVDYSINNINT